jgi:hypothetical protein
MKKLQSFYLILSFLSLIPHSLFSMDLCLQQLPMQDKQLALTKAIKQTLEFFKQKNNLPHESKSETFQNKSFYLQTHEGPNIAFAVFKIAHVSKLSPISDQEANKAHQLLQVYDYKNKKGICSVMFRYSNKQLLPVTKEQAAFLLVTPLLKEAIRTNELVSPDFLNPEQKQILSCSHPKHPELIVVQRKEIKSFLESGKLVKVFKIESGFASSTQATQAINALNHLLHLYHGSGAEQKTALYIKSKLQVDTVCDYALHEGFALGTIIQTDADPKKIEAIQVGDLVLSKDITNNMQVVCPVTHIAKEQIPSYIEIVLEHETIITAPGQKFYSTALGDWITVQEIMQSEELQAQFQEPILEIRQVNESIEIYKLTIAHEHNFYITEKQLLAHNFAHVLMNPDLIVKAFDAGTNVFMTYVIPFVEAIGPVVGPAIGGFAIVQFIKGFMGGKQGDIDRDYPFGKQEQQDKKDKKDKHDTQKDKNKHQKHKKKSKEKEPKQYAASAKSKDQNGPSEQNQCTPLVEVPKLIGCGNNIEIEGQNGLSKPKQCNPIDEIPKSIGCGNNTNLNGLDELPKQKQCNHSQGSQASFEHSKDYKNDAENDSQSKLELLPNQEIIHTDDNSKQETAKSNSEKEEIVSELSGKANNKPNQETEAKDLDAQLPGKPTEKDEQAVQAEAQAIAKEIDQEVISLTELRQEIVNRERGVIDSDREKLGFTGIRVKKSEVNQNTGRIGINTELDGGLENANNVYEAKVKYFSSNQELVEEGIKTTDNGEKRIYSRFKDGTFVQLRILGSSGHPKVDIIDISKNIKEKITFK